MRRRTLLASFGLALSPLAHAVGWNQLEGGVVRDERTNDEQHYTPTIAQSAWRDVDLTSKLPAAYLQGLSNDCVPNAFAPMLFAIEPGFFASRLFMRWTTLSQFNVEKHDWPMAIKDCAHAVSTLGVCNEWKWPYLPERYKTRPNGGCYRDALRHKSTPLRLDALGDLIGCLNDGFPFVFGAVLYTDFEGSVRHGIASMPGPGAKPMRVHAFVGHGVDLANRRILARNDAGTGWGINGSAWFPFDYFTEPGLTSDIWTMRRQA